MALTSQPRIDDQRFISYVEELQQFSADHELQYGSPAHLPALLAALNGSGDFRDECTSMLRSIVYREQGQALPPQLLELVASAWGGPPTAESASSLQETLRSLLKYVSGVMRTPQEALPSPLDTDLAITALAPNLSEAAQYPSEPATVRPQDQAQAVPNDEGRQDSQSATLAELNAAIQILEIGSPEVQQYVQLLLQRAQMTNKTAQAAVQPPSTPAVVAVESLVPFLELVAQPSLPPVGIAVIEQSQNDNLADSGIPSAPQVEPEIAACNQPPSEQPLDDAKPPVSVFDPWDENSELQRELRRFAEYRAREAAFQADMAARPITIKFRDGVASIFGRAPRRDLMPPHDDQLK